MEGIKKGQAPSTEPEGRKGGRNRKDEKVAGTVYLHGGAGFVDVFDRQREASTRRRFDLSRAESRECAVANL